MARGVDEDPDAATVVDAGAVAGAANSTPRYKTEATLINPGEAKIATSQVEDADAVAEAGADVVKSGTVVIASTGKMGTATAS